MIDQAGFGAFGGSWRLEGEGEVHLAPERERERDISEDMFVPVAKPDKATALKELKRNTLMLAVWCGVVRAIPYVLHGLQQVNKAK